MEENVVGTLISRMDENLREMFLAYWLGTSAVAITIIIMLMTLRELFTWLVSRIRRQKESPTSRPDSSSWFDF